jgi:hypothetical protein
MVFRSATAGVPRVAAIFLLLCAACGDGAPSQPPMDGGAADVDLAACVADGPIASPRENCPAGLPDGADCPSASPIYDEVAPIFAARCTICHHPGGLETRYQFNTYSAIHADPTVRRDILFQIFSCRMPPSCAPNLAPDERSALLEWFICGDQVDRDGGVEIDAGVDLDAGMEADVAVVAAKER